MSDAETTQLEVDDIVDDRYRVCERTGQGPMGTTYRVVQLELQRELVLEVLGPKVATGKSAVQQFEREAEVASSIDHRNVVEILDFGHLPSGELYYVMERIEGQELSELLERSGALPWSRAGWIIIQIVHAFAALHEQGLVDLGIEPQGCVLLDPRPGDEVDSVKVCALGLANLERRASDVPADRPGDTPEHAAYMAPELLESGHGDARTDVYSLGILMYELLTGTVPFVSDDLDALVRAHREERPIPPRTKGSDIPAEVESVLLRTLAKAPDERFGSMAELEEALMPLVHLPGTRSPSATTSRSPRPTHGIRAGLRRHGRSIALGTIMLVAAAVLGLWQCGCHQPRAGRGHPPPCGE